MLQSRAGKGFNDGVLTIYAVPPESPYGRVKESELVPVESGLRYREVKLGMTRFWTGYAAGEDIRKVVRLPLRRGRSVDANMVIRLRGALGGDEGYYTVQQSQPDLANGWEDLTLGVFTVDKD